MDETLKVKLRKEMLAAIDEVVAEGAFENREAFVAAAIDDWFSNEVIDAIGIEKVRAGIQEALADPRPSMTLEEVRRHFDRRLARREQRAAEEAKSLAGE